MKKRRTSNLMFLSTDREKAALLLVSGGFLFGAVLGCLMAASVSGDGATVLADYIRSVVQGIQAGTQASPALFLTIWNVFRWPLLALLMSFSFLGIAGIPALCMIRGFLLSYCAAAFARMFGAPGVLLAFVLYGCSSLLSVPALFALGTQGVSHGIELRQQMRGKKTAAWWPDQRRALTCVVCMGVLAVCTALEMTVVPALVGKMAGLIAG